MKSTAQNPSNANFKSILVKYTKGWTNGQMEKHFNKMNSKKLNS